MSWYQKLLASFLFVLARIAGKLPMSVLYFKAGFVRFFAVKLLRYRYQVIVQNISRSFPDYNYRQVRQTAHDFYRHFFDVFTEVIALQGFNKQTAVKHLTVENPELLNSYHDRGINVIAMAGHRGNWEWVTILPLHFKFSVYTLYKPLSDKVMESLMNRIRKRFGIRLLSMNQAGRFILSRKDFPAVYLFVGDQSPSHKDLEFCFDFMNQPSFLFTGGAKLARATKSAVVYLSITKQKRGYYSVRFTPIADPDSVSDEKAILRRYAQLLEEDIRRQPANYLWSHKRWKNLPPPEQKA